MTSIARSGWLADVPIMLICALVSNAGQNKPVGAAYKALNPVTEGNLTIFPIVTESTYDTHNFLTLDEGLRSGLVVVTEEGGTTGLVRPAAGAGGPS